MLALYGATQTYNGSAVSGLRVDCNLSQVQTVSRFTQLAYNGDCVILDTQGRHPVLDGLYLYDNGWRRYVR